MLVGSEWNWNKTGEAFCNRQFYKHAAFKKLRLEGVAREIKREMVRGWFGSIKIESRWDSGMGCQRIIDEGFFYNQPARRVKAPTELGKFHNSHLYIHIAFKKLQ